MATLGGHDNCQICTKARNWLGDHAMLRGSVG
jgi:hypothetical protein